MDRDEVWRAIARERRAVAELLDGLTPRQWEWPSLCAGWRVRDVAAHLTHAQTTGLATGVVEFVRARGSFDKMVRDSARRRAARPVTDLVAELRSTADSRRLPPVTSPRNLLADVLVHGQDIAVPLCLEHPVLPESGRVAAEQVWSMGWPFYAQRRLAGFRMIATDTEWAAGSGAPVEGPVGALLLLLTGRPAGLSRLVGDGASQLAERR